MKGHSPNIGGAGSIAPLRNKVDITAVPTPNRAQIVCGMIGQLRKIASVFQLPLYMLLDDEELKSAKLAFLKQAAKVDQKFVSSLGFTVPFSRRFIALAQLIAEHYDQLYQKFKKVEFLGHELTKEQAKVLAVEYIYNCYILENNLHMYHEVINSGKARTKIDLNLMDFK